MRMGVTIRVAESRLARLALAAAMLALAAPGLAQVTPVGQKSMGDPAPDRLPDILRTVKIDQRLGQQLPLDTPFGTRPASPSNWGTTSASAP
jgi:hypothetical protein